MSYRCVSVASPTFAAVRNWTARTSHAVAGGRLIAHLLMCCGLGVAASGCSMSIPMAGFVDPLATGSIERPDGVIFNELDQEDGRRARAALAVALDPQGNGASVAWSNPQSGAKGSFVAAALPYTAGSLICRPFTAYVSPDARTDRAVDGSACRKADGDWLVSAAAEIKVAKDTAKDAKDLRKLRG